MVALFTYFFGIFKKIFLVVFVLYFIISAFGYFIQKDKPTIANDPITNSRARLYHKIHISKLNDSTQGKIVLKVFRIGACVMTGEVCTDNPKDGDKNFDKSVFGFASHLITLPYMNPPASGVYWAKDTLQNAGLAPKSYASEGIGFSSIKPIMGLWKVFRDVSYMLLVLFLVIIGFMIMFRVKINPQTVISVENTLPKIAVTMIFITFSFAIAGFMIDMMYVLTAIAISLFGNVSDIKNYNVPELQNAYLSAGPGNIYDALMGNIINKWQLKTILPDSLTTILYGTVPGKSLSLPIDILLNIIARPLNMIMVFGWRFRSLFGEGLAAILDLISAVFLTWFTPGIATGLGLSDAWFKPLDGVAGATFSLGKLVNLITEPTGRIGFLAIVFFIGFFLLPPLIIGILFIFTIFYIWARIFFLLFTSYIQIILLIIFSPFLIALELIPGSKLTFSQWLKNLAGELIAFPTVVIIFSVAYVIGNMNTFSGFIIDKPTFFTPPFLGGIDTNTLPFLLQIGLSFLIPDFVKMVKEAIGAKGLGVNAGLGLFFGGTSAAAGGIMGAVGTFSSIKLLAPGAVTSVLNKFGANTVAEWLSPSGTADKDKKRGG